MKTISKKYNLFNHIVKYNTRVEKNKAIKEYDKNELIYTNHNCLNQTDYLDILRFKQHYITYFPKKLLDNEKFVFGAIFIHTRGFNYISERLKRNKEFILKLFKNDIDIYDLLYEHLKQDEDIIYNALLLNKSNFFRTSEYIIYKYKTYQNYIAEYEFKKFNKVIHNENITDVVENKEDITQNMIEDISKDEIINFYNSDRIEEKTLKDKILSFLHLK